MHVDTLLGELAELRLSMSLDCLRRTEEKMYGSGSEFGSMAVTRERMLKDSTLDCPTQCCVSKPTLSVERQNRPCPLRLSRILLCSCSTFPLRFQATNPSVIPGSATAIVCHAVCITRWNNVAEIWICVFYHHSSPRSGRNMPRKCFRSPTIQKYENVDGLEIQKIKDRGGAGHVSYACPEGRLLYRTMPGQS